MHRAELRLLVPLLPHLLAAFAGLGELAIALGVDFFIATFEHVLGRDVADGTVKTRFVVMNHVIGNDTASVVQGERHEDADALALDGFVKAFELAVGLRVIGRSSHMGHAHDADELFEILGDELRPVVADDAGRDAGEFFAGLEDDGLRVGISMLGRMSQ